MYKWTKFLVTALCALQVNLYVWTAQSQEEDVRTFITRIPRDTYPYEKARSFSPADCDRVTPLLRNIEYEKYWNNILQLIGVVGNESHIPALLDFWENGSGESDMSLVEFQARQGVLLNLGTMGSRGIESATDALIELAVSEEIPEAIREFKVLAVDGYDTIEKMRSTLFHSLARTGSNKAEQQLESLKLRYQGNRSLSDSIDGSMEELHRFQATSYLEFLEEFPFGLDRRGGIRPKGFSEDPEQNYPDRNNEEWITEAIKQYREISTAYLTGSLAEVIPRLADDGAPIDFSSPRKRENREAFIDAVVAAQASNLSTGQITAVVNELPLERFPAEGNAVVVREKEMVIVKINCLGTRESVEPLIPDRWKMMYEGATIIPSHGGFTTEWDAMIYMIYKNGKWYWNAYGW